MNAALFGHTVTVKLLRPSDGAYNGQGRWVAGAETALTIEASVQRARPRDLMVLPENMRNVEALKLYTEDEIRTVEPTGGEPDIIEWEGQRWQVQSVTNHTEGVLNHRKVIAVKMVPKEYNPS
jgi:hypothetical protein